METGFTPTEPIKQVGHRWYDPSIGRFISRDPAKDGENWFTYCWNDPINCADPTGLNTGWGYSIGLALRNFLLNLPPWVHQALGWFGFNMSRWLNSSTVAKVSEIVDDMAPVASSPAPTAAVTRGAQQVAANGQVHHAISKMVHRALETSPLRGIYVVRDPRWATRALDLSAHQGYQRWHRLLDKEMSEWVRAQGFSLTRTAWEDYMRSRYGRPDLSWRFPNGF